MKRIPNGLPSQDKNCDKVNSYLYESEEGFYRINYVSESYWDEFQDERRRGRFGMDHPVKPLDEPTRPRSRFNRRPLTEFILGFAKVIWSLAKFLFGLMLDLIRVCLYLIFSVILLNLVGILLMGGGRRW